MREHFIAMDTHGQSCEIEMRTQVDRPGRQWHVRTRIPEIRQVIESIPRPRYLAFEEGPLAAWLGRELKGCVDRLVVCDPRRNAWVCNEGDKDDAIDTGKLTMLFMGGFLKPVHHTEDLSREVFKQTVGLYHRRVSHRVSEGNQVIGYLKRFGIVVRQGAFARASDRAGLMERLGPDAALAAAKENLELLLEGFDSAVKQEQALERRLIRLAKAEEFIVRAMELPGIGWIRASTFVVHVDTPFRFGSKQALWKYMGIGLVRRQSGSGPEYLHVDQSCNRQLRSMILGAAHSAIVQKDNVFARQHQRWLESGVAPASAKRNVARSQSAVLWGMWKSGSVFDPLRVGSS